MNTEKKPWEYGLLHTEKGCPYLLNGDRMFFWLGDTAWLLFSKLNREEMETYLRNRAEKGFTVIQAVAVHHFPAVNVYGQAAFADEEKKLPAEETENGYWELIDFAVRKAAELGMYVGLLPHWGDQREKFTMEQMESYVRFLAGRYGSEPNIIWVTGGDTRGSQGADYWKTMGRLLKERCPKQLVTFHPFGRTSSLDYFPEEDWLDFHMFQSGHRRYDQKVLGAWDDTVKQQEEAGIPYYGEDNWRYVQDVQKAGEPKPVLDGEPSYEHIPQGLHLGDQPYWSTEQVRRYGWWCMLAGGCGFTYGHNSVMQFYGGKEKGSYHVKIHWKDAIHGPACDSVAHMKEILEEILEKHFREAKPAQELLAGDCVWEESQKEERILAMEAGPWIVCYSYTGKTVELDGSRLGEGALSYWWVNPLSGVKSYGGRREISGESLKFETPKGDDAHKDWVLLLKKEEA